MGFSSSEGGGDGVGVGAGLGVALAWGLGLALGLGFALGLGIGLGLGFGLGFGLGLLVSFKSRRRPDQPPPTTFSALNLRNNRSTTLLCRGSHGHACRADKNANPMAVSP
jgi:hypothetical protein